MSRMYKAKYRYDDHWTYLTHVKSENKIMAKENILDFIRKEGRTNREPDELIIELKKKNKKRKVCR